MSRKKLPSARNNGLSSSRLRLLFYLFVILLMIIGGLARRYTFQQTLKPNTTVVTPTTDSVTSKACTPQTKSCPDGTYVWRKGETCEYTTCPSRRGLLTKEEVKSNIQREIRPYLQSTIDTKERPDWIDFKVLVTDEDIKVDGGYAFTTIYAEPVVVNPEKYTEIIGGIMLVMTLTDSSGVHSYTESQPEFWQPFFEAPDSVVSQNIKQLYEVNRPQ